MHLIATATVFLGTAASAQQPAAPVPPPDIFLASLDITRGTPRVGAPMNFTDRPGYDNQPSFTSDGRAVLFTSVRADAQADIYRYDIAAKRATRVTATAPESEYSATAIEGGRAIPSCAWSVTPLSDYGGFRSMEARQR